jgi:hypothetical protein
LVDVTGCHPLSGFVVAAFDELGGIAEVGW